MKKITIIFLLITFCITLVAPQMAFADSLEGCLKSIGAFTLLGAGIWAGTTVAFGNNSKLGEATLIGAGLGAVSGLIICIVTPAKESPQNAIKSEDEKKISNNYVYIPENQIGKISSDPGDYNNQKIYFAFQLGF